MGPKEIVAALILCCTIVCDPVSDGNNSNPVIESITFIPDTIVAGESCLVQCRASDPDNDHLSFEWETIGNIAGSGSNIFYTPNDCCGSPEITVTVKDGRGGRADSQFIVPFKYE